MIRIPNSGFPLELVSSLASQSNLTLLLPTEAALAQLPTNYTTELLNNKVVQHTKQIYNYCLRNALGRAKYRHDECTVLRGGLEHIRNIENSTLGV
jgi:hypothetical protein